MALAGNTQWWKGGVIYQIYPRSYQDTNGDGIGDLPGIIQRLPYIASLGVDAIWISPFFPSPMHDFGYDVSDYFDVDPMFGTLADFDSLVEQAHHHGIRIVIDLVLSHTSSHHAWFKESRSSRDNPKSDWYVWADAKSDGTPPNNWLSFFGGAAWKWDSRREQYYLHNFLSSQPDLNLHTPRVQEELLGVAQFWLERGVDGFRLDTLNFYFADKDLRDNPSLDAEKRNSDLTPRVNPYNHQDHVYSKNRPETIDFLKKFRALLQNYPGAACVGEIGDAQRGLDLIGTYTSGRDKANMCYAFDLLCERPLTPDRIVTVLKDLDRSASDAWACWAYSNHDVTRHASRWNLNASAVRLYATILMCLRGTACIYQGEELGWGEVELDYDDLTDPYGIEFWPEYKGRDGCRTPMAWHERDRKGGFTTGRPWLPLGHDHLRHSVSHQELEPAAVVHHYRRVIAFRHAHEALKTGSHENLTSDGDILSFERRLGKERILCIFNMSDTPTRTTLPKGDWVHIGQEIGSARPGSSGDIFLGPWQPALAKMTS